jgi:hypothetical protein
VNAVDEVLGAVMAAALLIVVAAAIRDRVAGSAGCSSRPRSSPACWRSCSARRCSVGWSGRSGGPAALADGAIPRSVLDVWSALPGVLISVVFAALFIGKEIPAPRRIWEIAGPQVALGQSIAWGQYVVGIGLGMLVLSPVFGLDPMAGALIEIGFEGGHGTAAGLAGTFDEFGFAEGADLALALATIGLVSGVVLGTVLVNWAVRTGRIDPDGGLRIRARRSAPACRPTTTSTTSTTANRPAASRDRHRSHVDPPRLHRLGDRHRVAAAARAAVDRERRPGAVTTASSCSCTCPCSRWR